MAKKNPANADPPSGTVIGDVIVIIGAGICGLATAFELSRRGAQTVVIERGEPFAEQSAGLARIFRIAHRRPQLCGSLCGPAPAGNAGRRNSASGRLLGAEGFITVAGTRGHRRGHDRCRRRLLLA